MSNHYTTTVLYGRELDISPWMKTQIRTVGAWCGHQEARNNPFCPRCGRCAPYEETREVLDEAKIEALVDLTRMDQYIGDIADLYLNGPVVTKGRLEIRLIFDCNQDKWRLFAGVIFARVDEDEAQEPLSFDPPLPGGEALSRTLAAWALELGLKTVDDGVKVYTVAEAG